MWRCDTDLFILTRKDTHQLFLQGRIKLCHNLYTLTPYIKFAYVFVQICRYSYFTVYVQKGLEVQSSKCPLCLLLRDGMGEEGKCAKQSGNSNHSSSKEDQHRANLFKSTNPSLQIILKHGDFYLEQICFIEYFVIGLYDLTVLVFIAENLDAILLITKANLS